MKFISTKLHGVLDYIVGLLLIIAPWILNFDNGTAAQWVPVIVGALTIAMSIFTNYEAGLVRSISMKNHLALDVLLGIVLAASPWIFGFADYVYLPHLIVGLIAIGTGLFTETSPHLQHENRRDSRADQDMRHAH